MSLEEENRLIPRQPFDRGTSSNKGLTDTIESSPGLSGLQYLGNGNWQFNWKTPKSYEWQCLKLHLYLEDGTRHTANYSFTNALRGTENG